MKCTLLTSKNQVYKKGLQKMCYYQFRWLTEIVLITFFHSMSGVKGSKNVVRLVLWNNSRPNQVACLELFELIISLDLPNKMQIVNKSRAF